MFSFLSLGCLNFCILDFLWYLLCFAVYMY